MRLVGRSAKTRSLARLSSRHGGYDACFESDNVVELTSVEVKLADVNLATGPYHRDVHPTFVHFLPNSSRDDRIIAKLRRSALLLADFTEGRQSVCEAGFGPKWTTDG